MLTVYSLKNCDTCIKAFKWLNEMGISYKKHDIRVDSLSREDAEYIVGTLGWEKALNRRSTTWRGLDDKDKADIDNEKAVDLIVEYPTLMKRPVFVKGDSITSGFDDQSMQAVRAML